MGHESDATKIARIDERVKAMHDTIEKLEPFLSRVEKHDTRLTKLERDSYWTHRLVAIIAAGGAGPKMLAVLGKLLG